MTSSAIVQKLWNYCNVLRDDPSAPDCEHRSGRCEHLPAPWQAGGMSYLLARGRLPHRHGQARRQACLRANTHR
ncbi:MAG: hypothetical protein UY82_C0062G0003 [Candidatus Uhrbacteria bacterium GW2011_GWC2_53_7]|uniref:Uncharacterized protein n=1 Tax=Candidatus Uhrbacteria bacterium GW2011_GWC2_53_7 TaxID=1618986 RepID=A0A0G1XU44_9BACT|nr:MAG: hypothetical protein UY82_C0062G0003 [Candidatus Uhrbacteria bacterium GW2011_GWC2_53_7]